MSTYQKMYQEKLVKAETAARVIESGDWLDYGMFNGKPIAFDKALAARKDELSDIFVTTGVTVPPVPEIVTKDPMGETFTMNDLHFSLVTRMMAQHCKNVFYNPLCFGEAEKYFADGRMDSVNVGAPNRKAFVSQVTPMDRDGFFNWGSWNAAGYEQAMRAEKVIVEVNQKAPNGLGGCNERIHISQVDYIVEGENPDLFALPETESSEVDRKIAEHVFDHLRDGCCIQLGIGSMPNALGKLIAHTDLKDLGVHTEMLVDAFMHLHEAGKITGKYKSFDRNKIAYTFALGSQDLYDWIHNNQGLASYNASYILHPPRMAQMENLISINQIMQIDLYGQVNAESESGRQISGNGGLSDFVNGAYWAKGGRSILCLPSTHTFKDGRRVSRIVPTFSPGTITTVSRQMVNIVATEFGWVSMKGAPTWLKAEKLISIAHPDFRDDLIKAAEAAKIWRQSNKVS
ncbi:MAG: acetyl-CoA hydrolase/transferase family protein [Solirubrobacterales bacterium]